LVALEYWYNFADFNGTIMLKKELKIAVLAGVLLFTTGFDLDDA